MNVMWLGKTHCLGEEKKYWLLHRRDKTFWSNLKNGRKGLLPPLTLKLCNQGDGDAVV